MEYFASAGVIGIIFFLLCGLISFLVGLLWLTVPFNVISIKRSQKKMIEHSQDRNEKLDMLIELNRELIRK